MIQSLLNNRGCRMKCPERNRKSLMRDCVLFAGALGAAFPAPDLKQAYEAETRGWQDEQAVQDPSARMDVLLAAPNPKKYICAKPCDRTCMFYDVWSIHCDRGHDLASLPLFNETEEY